VPGWAFFYISKRLQEMIKRSCRRPERCSSGDRDAADRRADPAAAAIARLEWQRLLSLLTPRRRDLIERLYSEGWTQQQVADDLHVSKQRVSALLQETLERLESHACP
jgi:RNA polymerase sigma factor (sigma-70 family)